MKLRPIAQELLLIFMQALGLAPMHPARVRSKDRFDETAYSGRGVDTLD